MVNFDMQSTGHMTCMQETRAFSLLLSLQCLSTSCNKL